MDHAETLRTLGLSVFSIMLIYAQSSDPAELLERVRANVVASLPAAGYGCTATIDRSYFKRRDEPTTSRSCEQISMDRKRGRDNLELDKTDRLRLQVILTAEREIYSWSGVGSFSRDVDQITQTGDTGSGELATHLSIVFGNPRIRFRLLDQNARNLEFGFRMPVEASSYFVKAGDQWRVAGYDGSLTIDAASLALRRITIQSEQLAQGTSLCEATTTMEYDPQPRETAVLLPSVARTRTLSRDTRETEWITRLSECRTTREQVPVSSPPKRLTATSEVRFKAALTGSIDTSTAAAGDVIQARLVEPMLTPSSQLLAPAGTILTGRIMRMEHHLDKKGVIIPGPNGFRGRFFLIWLDFDRIEVNGVVSSIRARLICGETLSPQYPCLVADVADPKGDRAFMFPSESPKFVVPAGYTSTWLTVKSHSE